MILKSIKLQNFRNHKEIVIDFDKQNTFLVGENGAGKTNIIEAIYSFAILRPFRSAKKEVFVREGENYAKITLNISHQEGCSPEIDDLLDEMESGDTDIQYNKIIDKKEDFIVIEPTITFNKRLEIFWQTSPKRTVFKIDDIKLTTREFLNKKDFFAVLFVPDDLNLPFSSPSIRRKYISRTISPLYHDYFEAELKLEKILRQRNKLLEEIREGRAERSEIDFWNVIVLSR